MKSIILILTLFIVNIHFSQAFTKSDSVFSRYQQLHDKLSLEVQVLKSDNSLSIIWLGDCDEIEIIDQNGLGTPRIDCKDDTQLNISGHNGKSLTIRFWCSDRLIKEQVVN